jgi:uncharacterized protein (TIGR03435 family)
MDRFDVLAKVPADSTPETQKLMLQSLLEDRFKLVVRKDTRALPTYALTAGKKPQLKEADGTEETGRRPRTRHDSFRGSGKATRAKAGDAQAADARNRDRGSVFGGVVKLVRIEFSGGVCFSLPAGRAKLAARRTPAS